jgi:uncharacterized membrane protein
MFAVVERLFRHAVYELRGGFLVRPLVIQAVIGSFGLALPLVHDKVPSVDAWIEQLPVLAPHDPAAAAGVFAAVIGAMMTVVSIVLSVLLVAITLASIQFSPRILAAFVEDRPSQRTIGIFLGTFTYCLFAYPSARAVPPTTPAIAVLGAMVLALTCTVALVGFVHHIARSINVNFITERIACETERVIDATTPELRSRDPVGGGQPAPRFDGPVIRATRSGYIRYVDADRLRSIAKGAGLALAVERRVGHFVAEGVPFLRLSKPTNLDGVDETAILATIDLGPVRTMEQDVEFGLLQLVDIALKAISPAVNDPSTAINCIDQLSRILVRVASRAPARAKFFDPPGVVRVVLPELPFSRLVEVAFEQIVHYGKGDLAVSIRVQRAFADIAASTTDSGVVATVCECAERAAAQCIASLPEAGGRAIAERLAAVQAACGRLAEAFPDRT